MACNSSSALLDVFPDSGDAEQLVPFGEGGLANGQLFREAGVFGFFVGEFGAEAGNVRFQFVRRRGGVGRGEQVLETAIFSIDFDLFGECFLKLPIELGVGGF